MESTLHILLADDDIDEHLFFKEALNKINVVGHNVVSVYDGVQLLDYLKRTGLYKNSKSPLPDIIVLDLNMPVMDGIQAVKEIKALDEFKNIPIYVLSHVANVTSANTCRVLGCAGFFEKPSKNDKLARIIETILEREASNI
jgi:CheY-like chemotaxis protein